VDELRFMIKHWLAHSLPVYLLSVFVATTFIAPANPVAPVH